MQGELAGMRDHAGRADHGRNLGIARHDIALAEDRLEALDRIDTVLHRDDARRAADQRAELLRRLLQIPQLDGEQHDIDRRDACRVVGHLHVLQVQVAERTFDLQPVPADGIEMCAASKERHVVAGRRHPAAEVAADGPCRHHCNAHARNFSQLPTSRISASRW